MKLIVEPRNSAFCRTRVAWCIPPARKLICPGDYAPYFIMRRYIYIFPPGRKPSPCYQNKDDRTTSPLLLSLLFFSSRSPFFSPFFFIHALFPSLWLLHRIITRMQICPLDRYPRRVYPFFFYPRHGNGKYYLEKGEGYGSGYVDPSQLFRGRIIYLRFSLRKLLTLLLREASLGDTI